MTTQRGYRLLAMVLVGLVVCGSGVWAEGRPYPVGYDPTASPPAGWALGGKGLLAEEPVILAMPTSVMPFLDGFVDPAFEYANAVPVVVDFSAPDAIPGIVPSFGGPPEGPADLSYTIYAVYTTTDLYVAVRVIDANVVDDSAEAGKDDGVELFIDGDLIGDDATALAFGPEGFRVGLDVGGMAAGNGLVLDTDWFGAAALAEGGHAVEFRIPLASIDTDGGPGFVPAGPGSVLGFNVAVNDDDNGGEPFEAPDDTYGAWAGNPADFDPNREADWGRLILFAPTANPRPLPFIDDVEGGPGRWTPTGFWNLIQNPHQHEIIPPIVPDLVTLPDPGFLPPAHSGSGAWWYGQPETGTFIGADFDPGQEPGSGGRSMAPNSGSLISPPLDLTAAASASLRFASWWEIEGVDVDRYDLMLVEVSTDGGFTFEQLGRLNPINDVDGASFIPYSSGGLGEVGVWQQYTFDLTPFVGDVVLLRFRFDTVDGLYNGFRGWFIDDVVVSANALVGPRLDEVIPPVGSGGTIVTLLGANFVNGAVVSFSDGSSAAAVDAETAVIGAQQATALVPSLPEGLYTVAITNPNGLSDALDDAFAVTATQPPDVTGIQPRNQILGEATTVTITGAFFDPAALAYISDVPLANQVNASDTEITGDIGGLPLGFHNVRVQNPDGQFDVLYNAFGVLLPGAGARTVELPQATIGGGQFATFLGASFTDGLTNEGIGKIDVTIGFDPAVIAVIDILPGIDFPGFQTIQFESHDGVASATLIGLPPAGPGTELLRIGVQALTPGFSPLTWVSLVFNDDPATVHTLVDGSVDISNIDSEPPQVTATTRLPDTGDPDGPYPVRAQVFDNVSIAFVDLLYRVRGDVHFTPVPMSLLAGEGTVSGLVTDANLQPLAQADLHFMSPDGTPIASEVTDAVGQFAAMVPAGPGQLEVSAPGFAPASITYYAIPGGDIFLGTIVLVSDVAGAGALHGSILDAATGLPVEGADVVLRPGLFTIGGPEFRSTTSDPNGYYEFLDVPLGAYTLGVSRFGHIPVFDNVFVLDAEVVHDVVLSEVIASDALRIVLSWGSEEPAPADLDAHLSGPTPSGDRFHVYYSNRGALDTEPFAALDVDDVTFSGPETITVTQLRSGTYRYWVHNFTDFIGGIADSPALSTSAQAVVRVYKGSQLLQTFLPPPGGVGDTWVAFELDGDTGVIAPVNDFANSVPSDVLSEGGSTPAHHKPYAGLWAQAAGSATLQSEGGLYGAQIPGMPPGSVVEYYVQATDGVGNTGAEPMGAPYDVFAFKVILGDRLVFASNRDGDSDLYLATLGAPGEFWANLDGDQVGQVSPGSGMGRFQLSPDHSSLTFDIHFEGLADVTNAHFHNAPPGVGGGVVRSLLPHLVDHGDGTWTISGVWTSADSEPFDQAMFDELVAGNLYVNVHTSAVGSGEIRGQLTPVRSLVQLTDDGAFDAYPCFSPNGTQIAFSSDRDGDTEIYLMDADGSNVVQLTDNVAYDGVDSPSSFSPDGTQIVFESDRDGGGDIHIFLMNADGSNVVQLTDDHAFDVFPSFSPDGTQILFQSDRDGGGDSEIFLMNADGSNVVQLTDNGAWEGQPSFSPDGTQIVFESDRDGGGDIYLMNADGSNVVQLTDNGAWEEQPSFSPDGSQIAFSSDRDGDREIYLMDADGSNVVRLTNNSVSDFSPAWAPSDVGIVGPPPPPPVGGWQVDLTVSNNGTDDEQLIFGLHPGATDGLDAGIGELEQPPLPPTSIYDARFQLQGLNGVLVDLRPADHPPEAVLTWTVQVQPGSGGVPLTFSWDLAQLPPNANMRLQDGLTGGGLLDVNMYAQTSVQSTNAALTLFQIVYSLQPQGPVATDFTYNLPAGWSMVSLPRLVDDSSLQAVFPTAISLFAFNSGYQTAAQLQPGVGYWVNLPGATTSTITGTAVGQLLVDLPVGWSMVGGPSTNLVVADVDAASGDQVISVFGFSSGYQPAATIEPGAGYWINMQSAANLDFTGSGTAKPVPQVTGEPFAGPVLWVESQGRRQQIELGAPLAGLVALPPLPPSEVLDARVFVGGVGTWQVPAVAGQAEYALRVQGPDLRLGWDVPEDAAAMWALRVDGAQLPLAGRGRQALGSGLQELRLLQKAGVTPTVFSLTQNYPNPFNPSTTIRYSLPQDAQVRLWVYDVAGQVVRELVSEWKPAGDYQVEWDSRNARGELVANGVYLYELQAGSRRAVRRMVLMK